MSLHLARLYAGILPPPPDGQGVSYSVVPVRDMPRYSLGKSTDGAAALLMACGAGDGRARVPIRLENLEVEFNVSASVRRDTGTSEGTFTIIRCKSTDPGLTDYFLTTAEALVGVLGAEPSDPEIARAVNRLAIVFQRLRGPASQTIAGLFGELFVIHQGRDRASAIRAWRLEESSRFDFASGDLRLDSKTTSGRIRSHIFSYDQCNPPPGTIAIVASIFAERLDEGVTLRSLLGDLERSVENQPELFLKLRETVAATLGSSASEGLAVAFDLRLAQGSLRFFDLREIPAIRGELPPGIRNVQFQSDLSAQVALPVRELERRCAAMVCFLPPV